ncbi:BglG family transcription antiterminator LicT [Paenibacillus sp. Leaf72]|uniref:BglG family transcription antiterminator LicT n=1 Tax=Paenibacillus sp. Leaf72 TaxID=1736234 RepID=UPI0006FDD78D|nr:PRD domain-containing protein [Paenibacillus sp. Leaf72]KQO12702.1 antitermination protein BlgG [Paenibacillus sp. Leaf72]
MKVIKILNSSVVLAKRDDQKEVIVLGKGIGYNSKAGDKIRESDIEKIYVPQSDDIFANLSKLMKEIPEDYLFLADEIITFAKGRLNKPLSEHLYVALTDHLHMAVKRFKVNMTIQNRLLWEVKKFYPFEFSIGEYALGLIEQRLGVALPEEEAANIAFHLVNAQQTEDNMSQVILMTDTYKDILQMIKQYFDIELEPQSISYSRFMTHLQFFIQRLTENKMLDSDDHALADQIVGMYPEVNKCVLKIKQYIEKKFGYSISDEEKMYLILHIKRVVSRG